MGIKLYHPALDRHATAVDESQALAFALSGWQRVDGDTPEPPKRRPAVVTAGDALPEAEEPEQEPRRKR